MVKVDAQINGVRGFRAIGIHAGLKKNKKLDLALISADRPCTVAGVFTRNLVKAAPVLLNMEAIASDPSHMRALVVNTACANACTGEAGMANARQMRVSVAEQLNIRPEQVLVMSTGVIGTQLPMPAIISGIEKASEKLSQRWEDAAAAIMTTDTRPKFASVTVYSSEGEYTIAGMSKGSGMIAPNMATMLGVVVTDAALNAEQANAVLTRSTDKSFNRIVVDGDTSTNDMVVLMASGASGVRMQSRTDLEQFEMALTTLNTYLAQQIVRDGEGVSKFITLDIIGAESDEDALQIGRTISASPLVKTAFYGNDANWGRIIAAAGRSGVSFDPASARLWFAPGETLPEEGRGLLLFSNGMPTAYDEAEASGIIRQDSVYVTLDCGMGKGAVRLWTCDLSHDYVSINAEYRS